jgi:hypothetical protein
MERMVERLYGVVHGYHTHDIFSSRRDYDIIPSRELQKELSQLPKGTRIGIEWFTDEDLKEVRDHFRKLTIENELGGTSFHSETYWDGVVDLCQGLGHEVVFLEDTEPWKKYNQLVVENMVRELNRGELYSDSSETEREYHLKLINWNEEDWRWSTLIEQVHFLDRDAVLVENIEEQGLEVTICGLGHTESWIQREIFKPQRYAGDVIVQSPFITSKFFENKTSEGPAVFDFEAGKRKVRLLKKEGIVIGRAPDYVGTWNWTEPSKGYFELFIEERNGNKVQGTIEDLLGTATFQGTITNKKIKFVKRYDSENSTPDAIKDHLTYETEVTDENGKFMGFYTGGGIRGKSQFTSFSLVKKEQEDPIELAMTLYDLLEELR